MKKIMSFCVLVGAVCFGVVGCGGPATETPTPEAEVEQDVEAMEGEINPTANLEEEGGSGEEAPAQ